MESGLTTHQLSEELDQQRGSRHGDSESEAFWSEFIGSLKERGLTGTRLVICVGEAFPEGAPWA